jgi:hypothetical protein
VAISELPPRDVKGTNMGSWSELFLVAVESAVSEKLSSFGFKIVSAKPGYIVTQSEHCEIKFILEHITVAILIRPLEPADYEATYLNGVLNALAPGNDFLWLMEWLHSPDEIDGEVQRQVSLMVEHCAPILQGDFSEWPRIVSKNHGKKEVPQNREERIAQLRNQAENAYKKKFYLGVLQNYYILQKEPGVKLTDEELGRIREAKAWLNGFGSDQAT